MIIQILQLLISHFLEVGLILIALCFWVIKPIGDVIERGFKSREKIAEMHLKAVEAEYKRRLLDQQFQQSKPLLQGRPQEVSYQDYPHYHEGYQEQQILPPM